MSEIHEDLSQKRVSPTGNRVKARHLKFNRVMTVRDWARMRPYQLFQLLDIVVDRIDISAKHFYLARRRWIDLARNARQRNDVVAEQDVNGIYSILRNWQCPICGKVKLRYKGVSCSYICLDVWKRQKLLTRRKKPKTSPLTENSSENSA